MTCLLEIIYLVSTLAVIVHLSSFNFYAASVIRVKHTCEHEIITTEVIIRVKIKSILQFLKERVRTLLWSSRW